MKRIISFFALAVLMSTTLSSCFLFRGGHELCPAYGEVEEEFDGVKAKEFTVTAHDIEQRS